MLERMKKRFVQSAEDSKLDVLLAWHGCSEEAANDIAAGNTTNHSREADACFFGTSIYLTPQANHAPGCGRNAFGDTLEAPHANGEQVLLQTLSAPPTSAPTTAKCTSRL